MPKRCMICNCSNVADKVRNITIHVIPYYGDDQPTASQGESSGSTLSRKRGEKWSPSKYLVICLCHFAPEDYTQHFDYGCMVERSHLVRDEIGILLVPRLQGEVSSEGGGKALTKRAKRKVCKILTACTVYIHP